jgi:hypothetical protein
VTGTPASIWGYLLAADPKSDKARDFYTAPSLIQLAKSQNYSTALYCAYDTHFPAGWDNLNFLFDMFDHVVSKTTLEGKEEGKEVNALGMDDRIITAKVLEYLSTVDSSKPFLLLIIYNNLHLPYLVDFESNATFSGTPQEKVNSRAAFAYKMTDSMTEQV